MLTFNLKKEWFEKIKSGEKTHEYRIANDYWIKRLSAFDTKVHFKVIENKICLACGYPPKDDESKRLYAKVLSISSKDGLNTDLKVNNPVYDIKFELCEQAND